MIGLIDIVVLVALIVGGGVVVTVVIVDSGCCGVGRIGIVVPTFRSVVVSIIRIVGMCALRSLFPVLLLAFL